MGTQSITPEKPILPLKGKYDGRGKHGNYVTNSGSFTEEGKPGPKPKSRKSLAGSRSNRYLNRIEKLKSPVELFQDAINARNYSLAWTIRTELRAEAVGKPYVAINPASERQEPADNSRIAVAINNLQIVNGPQPAKKRAKEIEASAIGDTAQVGITTQPSPLVATNGGECRILPGQSTDGIEAAEKAGTLP